MRPTLFSPLGAPLRRLQRSFGSQRAIDNAASQLAPHRALFAEIDDLARRLEPPPAVEPPRDDRRDQSGHHAA